MSYILKDTTQGIISVKLTDAGRKKLSQGKLNIELFQLGDSEYCYDCNSRLPGLASGIEIQQANFNAQNLNAIPEKNKAHVKYPVPISQTSPNQTFGAAQAAHTYEEIFNRASQRGLYTGSTANTCSFSAFTGSAYTLNANLQFPVSAMTGGSRITLLSAHTFVDQAFSGGTQAYVPVIGDILGIHYQFYSGSTGTTAVPPCYDVPCTSPSAMLFYQIIGGNTSSGITNTTWSGTTKKPLFYTVDRELPDVMRFSGNVGNSSFIGNYTGTPTAPVYACVKVFPNVTGGTYSANSTNPMLTYFGASTPKPYWSPGSLSFENNCDVSVKDVKVWNMNIPWTEQVAGVDSTNSDFESVDYYGSTGYTGTKEYLGYRSNNGQIDTGTIPDTYDSSITSSSWYYDSYKNKVAVQPSRQKTVAILHYTNQTISNFYGEKFAMNEDASSKDEFGKAKNFRLCMPWLMWHKKYVNDAVQGCPSGATEYGQCFYTDPPGFDVFPSQPWVMQSSINPNMNDDGLRYYYLWDDNAGPQSNNLGQTKVGPNPVGKVFPDLKMVVIHDEELVAAMSYKSNRSWTLPAPKITKIPAGTNCVGTTSNIGVYNNTAIEENMYVTYLLESNSGLTTGLHCNYYTSVKNQAFSEPVDLEINFGNEFPYLKPFDLQSSFGLSPTTQGGITGGTGWQANKIHLVYQVTQPGEDPQAHLWKRVEVTDQIGGSGSPYITASTSTSYIPLSGCVLSSADTRFFLTKSLMDDAVSYELNDYITMPTASSTSGAKNLTGPQLLQFGDEYFYNGVLETDIMATIYEMKYNINLASSQFGNTPTGNGSSLNPTYQKYFDDNGVYPSNIFVTEVGLFDNKDGNPDLMAIAKFQSPHKRQGAEQFVLKIDF